MATSCKACGKGTAAVKVLEYENFETIPNAFTKSCSVILDSN